MNKTSFQSNSQYNESMKKNLYQFLGVELIATREQIYTAYINRLEQYKSLQDSGYKDPYFLSALRGVQEHLLDEKTRKKYDKTIKINEIPLEETPTPSSKLQNLKSFIKKVFFSEIKNTKTTIYIIILATLIININFIVFMNKDKIIINPAKTNAVESDKKTIGISESKTGCQGDEYTKLHDECVRLLEIEKLYNLFYDCSSNFPIKSEFETEAEFSVKKFNFIYKCDSAWLAKDSYFKKEAYPNYIAENQEFYFNLNLGYLSFDFEPDEYYSAHNAFGAEVNVRKRVLKYFSINSHSEMNLFKDGLRITYPKYKAYSLKLYFIYVLSPYVDENQEGHWRYFNQKTEKRKATYNSPYETEETYFSVNFNIKKIYLINSSDNSIFWESSDLLERK